MSSDSEKLLKALGSNEIAMQMLAPEDRELLVRFNEEVDMLREERNIPANSDVSDELIEEVFQIVPGAERALYKQTKIVDSLFGAGSG